MEDTLRMAIWRQKNPEKDKEQRRRYWEKLKADPIRHARVLKNRKNYPSWKNQYGKPKKYSELTKEQKERVYRQAQLWRKRHPELLAIWQKRSNDKKFFGGNRELAIQRDNEKCVTCGLSRQEHYIKYKRDITVDHKNRLGRGVSKDQKDNRLENLMTLCLSCHLRKDGPINNPHLND